MRTILMTLVVVGLLAAPSLGVINITLVSNKASIAVGETATISILAQGTVAGVAGVGGDIVGTTTIGAGALSSSNFAWDTAMFWSPMFPGTYGTAGANGGWSQFSSGQTAFPPSSLYGKAAPVVTGTYTVTGVTAGTVRLDFINSPISIHGYKSIEVDKSVIMGTITPVTIAITPEPATMVLLAIGGLLAARRRSH